LNLDHAPTLFFLTAQKSPTISAVTFLEALGTLPAQRRSWMHSKLQVSLKGYSHDLHRSSIDNNSCERRQQHFNKNISEKNNQKLKHAPATETLSRTPSFDRTKHFSH
jgi:hypothetical protein